MKDCRINEKRYDGFRILKNPVPSQETALPFTIAQAEHVLRFHCSLPEYRETELVSLKGVASRYGVDSIFVKDESTRFGLKAFKGLGGTYCMFRILCERFGFDYRTVDYSTFLDEEIRRKCREIEFVTATDGNHGKGVSYAAKLFGCKAHVFMPKGTVEARRKAIEDAGNAIARITEYNYDQTVRHAAKQAEDNGWILIQDTSWEGYEQIPAWIIEGYLTMAAESLEQMKGKRPTHIFLQAGVGAMAAGIESCFMSLDEGYRPSVAIVEAAAADCIYRSVLMNDGMPHSISGDPFTIMAGLNCGTPCGIAWPILRDLSTHFCSCEDRITEEGMRAYADSVIISGESGAVTYGLLLQILKSEELRELFGIKEDSVILLFNTEGDTDPEGYQKTVLSQ